MKTRRDRRARERAQRALARDLERLAQLAPGGTPENPIEVRSPAQIEPLVARTACPLCEGTLRELDHRARIDRSALREVSARCSRCGIARTLFFLLRHPLPH